MSNKKISELSSIATPDNADVFPIVDVSAVETKKITFANLVVAILTGATLNLKTEAVTAGITQVGDNVQINLTLALSEAFTAVQFVSRQGQVIMPNGNASLPGSSWSIAASTVTVYNADASDIFLIQYLYA